MSRTRDWSALEGIFAYPAEPQVRRHGPRGYIDDEHYKPWLRDEFTFRCIYCGCREVWFPDGDRSFSVEHMLPASQAPQVLTEYETLLYACCQCNAARGAALLPLDPCSGLGRHLQVESDGTVRPLTPAGQDLIALCRLDRANLTAFRRLLLDTLVLLRRKRSAEATELLKRFLAYPANLPNLAALRPPARNSRPEGVADCAWAKRRRGQLEDAY